VIKARYYCAHCRRSMDRFFDRPPAKIKSFCERTGKDVVMKKLKGDRHD
jgi:transposase-like protein